MTRLPTQVEMARWLIDSGRQIEGKRFLEVGTGHLPVVPIGFFLAGADEIITVDLHRRLDWDLTRGALKWIMRNREEVESLYADVVSAQMLGERLDMIGRWQEDPQRFCEIANIDYRAPYDAANCDMPDGSIDVHLSVTTLEHIPEAALCAIFAEARRILGHDGIALHFIDPSDHFEHADKSISPINFLRFSDRMWKFIADNEFAYCNRLRATDLLAMFRDGGWDIERLETVRDDASIAVLDNGFPLNQRFRHYAKEDLCITRVNVMLA